MEKDPMVRNQKVFITLAGVLTLSQRYDRLCHTITETLDDDSTHERISCLQAQRRILEDTFTVLSLPIEPKLNIVPKQKV